LKIQLSVLLKNHRTQKYKALGLQENDPCNTNQSTNQLFKQLHPRKPHQYGQKYEKNDNKFKSDR